MQIRISEVHNNKKSSLPISHCYSHTLLVHRRTTFHHRGRILLKKKSHLHRKLYINHIICCMHSSIDIIYGSISVIGIFPYSEIYVCHNCKMVSQPQVFCMISLQSTFELGEAAPVVVARAVEQVLGLEAVLVLAAHWDLQRTHD